MGAKSTTLLELFLAEHGKIIRLIGRIVGCRETAEDLAQDVFVKLWGRMVTDQDRSLLFRTAQTMAIDHVRAQRVRANYAQMSTPERGSANDITPDTSAAARQELNLLLQVTGAIHFAGAHPAHFLSQSSRRALLPGNSQNPEGIGQHDREGDDSRPRFMPQVYGQQRLLMGELT